MSASSERIFGRTRGTNPLKFDRQRAATAVPPSPVRRPLIAKVQIARKEMRMIEDDYRAILVQETGVDSAAKATDADLVKVLKRFELLGWKPKLANGKKAAPRPADHPGAGKARALWISLHQLGVIEDPSETALEAFARRQLNCERLQWADQSKVYRLIEALKAMAQRAGWDQSLEGVKPEARVIALKRRLVERQLVMLKDARFALPAWDVPRAAREFGGTEIRCVWLATASELDLVAQTLGRTIWDAKAVEAL